MLTSAQLQAAIAASRSVRPTPDTPHPPKPKRHQHATDGGGGVERLVKPAKGLHLTHHAGEVRRFSEDSGQFVGWGKPKRSAGHDPIGARLLGAAQGFGDQHQNLNAGAHAIGAIANMFSNAPSDAAHIAGHMAVGGTDLAVDAGKAIIHPVHTAEALTHPSTYRKVGRGLRALGAGIVAEPKALAGGVLHSAEAATGDRHALDQAMGYSEHAQEHPAEVYLGTVGLVGGAGAIAGKVGEGAVRRGSLLGSRELGKQAAKAAGYKVRGLTPADLHAAEQAYGKGSREAWNNPLGAIKGTRQLRASNGAVRHVGQSSNAMGRVNQEAVDSLDGLGKAADSTAVQRVPIVRNLRRLSHDSRIARQAGREGAAEVAPLTGMAGAVAAAAHGLTREEQAAAKLHVAGVTPEGMAEAGTKALTKDELLAQAHGFAAGPDGEVPSLYDQKWQADSPFTVAPRYSPEQRAAAEANVELFGRHETQNIARDLPDMQAPTSTVGTFVRNLRGGVRHAASEAGHARRVGRSRLAAGALARLGDASEAALTERMGLSPAAAEEAKLRLAHAQAGSDIVPVQGPKGGVHHEFTGDPYPHHRVVDAATGEHVVRDVPPARHVALHSEEVNPGGRVKGVSGERGAPTEAQDFDPHNANKILGLSTDGPSIENAARVSFDPTLAADARQARGLVRQLRTNAIVDRLMPYTQKATLRDMAQDPELVAVHRRSGRVFTKHELDQVRLEAQREGVAPAAIDDAAAREFDVMPRRSLEDAMGRTNLNYLGDAGSKLQTFNRALTPTMLALRPQYHVNNAVGGGLLLGAAMGARDWMHAPGDAVRALRVSTGAQQRVSRLGATLRTSDRPDLASELQGAVSSGHGHAVNSGLGRLSGGWNSAMRGIIGKSSRVTDDGPRIMRAMQLTRPYVEDAVKRDPRGYAGLSTTERMAKVLHDNPELRDQVNRQVATDMVDFGLLQGGTRDIATAVNPFSSWLAGMTVRGSRAIYDRPGEGYGGYLLAQHGQHVQDEAMPYLPPDSAGLLPIGHGRVVDLHSGNPWTTPTDVTGGVRDTLFSGDTRTTEHGLGTLVGPGLGDLAEIGLGHDLFAGRPTTLLGAKRNIRPARFGATEESKLSPVERVGAVPITNTASMFGIGRRAPSKFAMLEPGSDNPLMALVAPQVKRVNRANSTRIARKQGKHVKGKHAKPVHSQFGGGKFDG